MGEVLSQNEIDSLLSALSNGELDADEIKGSGEKQVKDYDFALYLNIMEDCFLQIFQHI